MKPPVIKLDTLLSKSQPRALSEAQVALWCVLVIDALEGGKIVPKQAWDMLFNLENYLLLKKHKASGDLLKLFEWGMELEDVEDVAPRSLDESLAQMRRMTGRLVGRLFRAPASSAPSAKRSRAIA